MVYRTPLINKEMPFSSSPYCTIKFSKCANKSCREHCQYFGTYLYLQQNSYFDIKKLTGGIVYVMIQKAEKKDIMLPNFY